MYSWMPTSLCSTPSPGRVLARRPPVAVADAVAPVVAADEVAARPAVDGRIELLEERQDLGPEAFDIVRRHDRGRSDLERAAARRDDLEPGVLGRRAGLEGEGEGPVIAADGLDREGLAGVRAVAPDEADGDRRGARVSGQDDAPHVFLPFDEGQRLLGDPARARARERHARRVAAREGLDLVHLDQAGLADRLPGRFALADRPEEFAVLEHLGPDPLVDAAAQVLDELAVDVLGHRLPGLAAVDHDLGRAEILAGEPNQLDVVEPGLARRPAPATEEARHFEGVVGAGVELDIDLAPIQRPRERRRPPVLLAVDVDLGAPARAGDEVLRLDEAAELVARVGLDGDGRDPRGVGAFRARDRDAAAAVVPGGFDVEGRIAVPLPAPSPPAIGQLPIQLLERAVDDELGDTGELVLLSRPFGAASGREKNEAAGGQDDRSKRSGAETGVHRSSFPVRAAIGESGITGWARADGPRTARGNLLRPAPACQRRRRRPEPASRRPRRVTRARSRSFRRSSSRR